MIDFIFKFSHGFPNKLRLLTLENSEIQGKSQYWVEAQPGTQYPCRNKFFCNSDQKSKKADIKVVASCLILFEFFTCCQIICPRLSVKETFAHISSSLVQTLIFCIVFNPSSSVYCKYKESTLRRSFKFNSLWNSLWKYYFTGLF